VENVGANDEHAKARGVLCKKAPSLFSSIVRGWERLQLDKPYYIMILLCFAEASFGECRAKWVCASEREQQIKKQPSR
jgi:hypothetical protein